MLGALKTAATGAMDAMRGSNQASDSQDSRRTCRNLSVDESRHGVHMQLRARGELMTKSRTEGKTPKDSQQHREEAVIPAHIAAEVMPALEAELTQREEELDQLTYEHGELKEKYGELREKHREVKRDAESGAKRLTDCDKNLTFLHGVFSDLVTKHLDPYAKRNGLNIDIGDWNTSDIDKAVKKMARDANEASTLQDQVRVLQKELITKVDKVKVATDEQLAQDFRSIVALIKTLSRTMRFIENVNPNKALGAAAMMRGVWTDHWNSRPKKKCLVEAWVWSILIDEVFCTPFAMFGTPCSVLSTVWQRMFHQEHYNDWPTPSCLSEKWRCATVEQMIGRAGRDIITKGLASDVPHKLQASNLKVRNLVTTKIQTGLANISASPDHTQIQNIIDKAFSLVLLMSLQPYRLQITYPKAGDMFNTEEMKAMHGPDGEDNDKGAIAFIVNPGLTKWGDTHGAHFDHRYDIVPCLVQLDIPAAKQEEQETVPDLMVSDR